MAVQTDRVRIPERADVPPVPRAIFTRIIRVRPRSIRVSDKQITQLIKNQ